MSTEAARVRQVSCSQKKKGERERPLCGQGWEKVVLPSAEEGRGEGRVKNQALRAAWEATGGFKHRRDIMKVSIRSTPSINSIKVDPFCARPFPGRAGAGVQNLVRYRDNEVLVPDLEGP